MFENGMNLMMLQQLMAQMQNPGAQGFMMPGGGIPQPASGAPQLPQMTGQRGASAGMPAMPSAFGATGQMNGPSGQGGMFGQMASNPMALMSMMNGVPGINQAGAAPSGAGIGGSNFNPDDIFRMKQMFANGGNPMPQQAEGQGGLYQLIRSMFGGGGG